MGFSLLVCGFELEWKMCSVRFRNHQTQKRVDKVGFDVKAAAAGKLSLSGFVGDSPTTESLSQNVREKNFTLCMKMLWYGLYSLDWIAFNTLMWVLNPHFKRGGFEALKNNANVKKTLPRSARVICSVNKLVYCLTRSSLTLLWEYFSVIKTVESTYETFLQILQEHHFPTVCEPFQQHSHTFNLLEGKAVFLEFFCRHGLACP